MTVEAHLLESRKRMKSWHIVLNNRASTRPMTHGGNTVEPITARSVFSAPGPAKAVWRRTLTLPRSFAKGDDRRVGVQGEGISNDDASELACLKAVAALITAPPQWSLFVQITRKFIDTCC